jgi:hypothetical protein
LKKSLLAGSDSRTMVELIAYCCQKLFACSPDFFSHRHLSYHYYKSQPIKVLYFWLTMNWFAPFFLWSSLFTRSRFNGRVPRIGQLWFAQQLIHETTTCHHHHCHSMDYHIFPSPFSCSIWQTTAREFILLPRLLRWKSIQFLSLGRERTKIKRADRLDYISTTADTFRGVCSKKNSRTKYPRRHGHTQFYLLAYLLLFDAGAAKTSKLFITVCSTGRH